VAVGEERALGSGGAEWAARRAVVFVSAVEVAVLVDFAEVRLDRCAVRQLDVALIRALAVGAVHPKAGFLEVAPHREVRAPCRLEQFGDRHQDVRLLHTKKHVQHVEAENYVEAALRVLVVVVRVIAGHVVAQLAQVLHVAPVSTAEVEHAA